MVDVNLIPICSVLGISFLQMETLAEMRRKLFRHRSLGVRKLSKAASVTKVINQASPRL